MLNTDLEVYLPKTVSDDTSNGGRMSSNVVVSGVVQNVWPHVPRAERVAGSTKHRKLFCKVSDDDDGTLISPQYWLDDVTPGDDWFVMFAGTQEDTQNDITGAERKFGVASLSSDTVVATKTIVCDLEDDSLATGNDQIFQDGDTIRVTTKDAPDSISGDEQFLTITSSSYSSPTLTITAVEDVDYIFDVASNARVMSVYEPGDCESSVGTVVVTSASGTFDDSQITLDNIGTPFLELTITFASGGVNFTVATDDADFTLASGDINTLYEPLHPDFSKPIVSIPALAFGGTFAQNDTVVIPLNPAAFSVWERRTVPANASSQANNKITLVTAGEAE